MVSADFEVVDLGAATALAPEAARRVDELWLRRLVDDPGLHDGEIFSVVEATTDRITGSFVPYRRFVAQRAEPALRTAVGVAPLAVTGRTVTTDRKVVLARRGPHVTQAPGAWELAPSGGVDRVAVTREGRVDVAAAVLAELGEELGIGREEVLGVTPVGVVVDDASGVYDVVLEVQVGLDGAGVRARFDELQQDEYRELRLVPLDDLSAQPGDGPFVVGFSEIAGLPFGA